MEKVFIIEYEGRVIGVWDNLESASNFIKGCHQSGLMYGSAHIKTFGINSCYYSDIQTIQKGNLTVSSHTPKVKFNENISNNETKLDTVEPKISQTVEPKISQIAEPKISQIAEAKTSQPAKPKFDPNNPAMIEMAKQKVELQHKINLLKQQKKKIEESKNTYTNDIKLFELFTGSKQKDPNFVVPEIFIKKFDLMTKLKNNNNLTWENFVKEFQHENIYNEYFGLNSYEEIFLESDDEDKSDISEELDIETDSSTDTSDDEKSN